LIDMATVVNAKAKKVLAKYTVGTDTFVLKMQKGRTEGTLFGLMGLTVVDTIPAGAIELRRDSAVDQGKMVPMVAEVRVGTRFTTKKIYIPTSKVEECVAQGAGKTIGSAVVSRIRGVRTRIYI
jgi:hypothetical protein